MSADHGSTSVVLVSAVGVALVLAGLITDVAVLVTHRLQTAAAADAAALAAAPVTFRSFGAPGTPRDEAATLARENGAYLLHCFGCEIDGSLVERTVRVVVGTHVDLVFFGHHHVTAASSATYAPLTGVATTSQEVRATAPKWGRGGRAQTRTPSLRSPGSVESPNR